MKTCNIEDCENGGKLRRGWCPKHYERWRRHGDPLGAARRGPEATFLAMTEPIVGDPGCIIWTGALAGRGYGQLRVNGRMTRAHRYAWERERGPIPDGMHVDHICYVRSCVNTDHLRLATRAQNAQNRSGARKGRRHDLPRGVYRTGRGYSAQVTAGGVLHHLGAFDTVESASAAAQAKRAILFGEFAGRA